MAKRETNTRRQAKGNRETTAQRRERERKRWAILGIADWILWRIYRRRLAQQQQKEIGNRSQIILDHLLQKIDAEMTKRDTWMESEPIENIVKALRLAADKLDGKPRDGRTFSAHNSQILRAWHNAAKQVAGYRPSRATPLSEDVSLDSTHQVSRAPPTFSEFLRVYREQNPGAKVEGRTLRRTLERLHLPTLPVKRGRPRGK